MSTFDAARYRETERQVYSQKALSYEKYGAPIFEALAAPLLEAARLERGQRVLDIACGLGIPSLTAATMVAPRGSVMGVDLAPG
ncbi:MAG: methyltransferase, partial [Deltaproteobacteria bacterium]|nr:methyltransferase [Deltaproteobacteria bacterium]